MKEELIRVWFWGDFDFEERERESFFREREREKKSVSKMVPKFSGGVDDDGGTGRGTKPI